MITHRAARILATAAALSVMGLTLGACGGRSPSAEQTRAAGPPTAVVLTPVAQGLTFTGRVAGTMSTAAGKCEGDRAGSLFQVTLTGDVDGARHSVRAVAQAYDGPGRYTREAPRRAIFHLDNGPGNAGTLVVNDDGASGSVDVDLLDGQHVSGTWSCTVIPE